VRTREHDFVHVGIGSGHRAQPLGTSTQDRFYALRDYRSRRMTQADFDALRPATDASMTPVTSTAAAVPAGAPGWRLDLDDGGWRGEKVLAEARTFADEVWFTTFRPAGAAPACEPRRGTQRIYRMRLFDGSPVANLDGSADETTLTSEDRYLENEGGIPPEPQLIFPVDDLDLDGIADDVDPDRDGDGLRDDVDSDDDGDGVDDSADDDSTACRGEGCGGTVICVGTICSPASFTNAPVRSYWRQEHVDD
jgi:hypothetical protein